MAPGVKVHDQITVDSVMIEEIKKNANFEEEEVVEAPVKKKVRKKVVKKKAVKKKTIKKSPSGEGSGEVGDDASAGLSESEDVTSDGSDSSGVVEEEKVEVKDKVEETKE